jgi:hypothetical protein
MLSHFMNVSMTLVAAGVLSVASGQPLSPVNSPVPDFLSLTLINLASSTNNSYILTGRFNAVVNRFGLNQQEATSLMTITQQLKTALANLQSAIRATTAGKRVLTASDQQEIAGLLAGRDQLINQLLTTFLSEVRPQTAAVISSYAKTVNSAVAQSGRTK